MVHIVFDKTNEVLYPDSASDQECQVLVLYEGNSRTITSGTLTVADKVYRLSDATSLIQLENSEDYLEVCVAGRLEWDSLLSSVFGPELKTLIENSHVVGQALGSLARILEIIAAETSTKYIFSYTRAHYNNGSFGKGLVANIIHRFPELIVCREYMEEAVCQSATLAWANYETYLTMLRKICNCNLCQHGPTQPGELNNYCCIIIIEMVAIIARAMSIMALPITVFPSRLGIEALYAHQIEVWQTLDDKNLPTKEFSKFDPALRVLRAYPRPILGAIRIFCGRVPKGLSTYDMITQKGLDKTCAFSAYGICVYYEALSQLSNDSKSFERVNIVPGRVELYGKVYAHVTDLTSAPGGRGGLSKGYPKTLLLNEVSLLIKEKSSSLQIAFEVCGQDLSTPEKVLMYPAETIQRFCDRRGLIRCKGTGCSSIGNLVTIQEDKPGYKLCKMAKIEIEVFEANLLQRWLLTNIKSPYSLQIFYADQECLDCCFHAVMSSLPKDGRNCIIIRSKQDEDDWNALRIPTREDGDHRWTKKMPKLFRVRDSSGRK